MLEYFISTHGARRVLPIQRLRLPMQVILLVVLLTFHMTSSLMRRIVVHSADLLLQQSRARMRLLSHSASVFSDVHQYTISSTRLQVSLSSLQVMKLQRMLLILSSHFQSSRLKSVRYSLVSHVRVSVQNVTDVTLLPEEWLREVRLSA